MLYRFAGHHYTLVFIALGVMTVEAGVMTDQVEFLLAHLETNFIPAEVAMEGSIVILIACFGVFLEHRRNLLAKIYPEGVPERIERFDRSSHHVGVMFIMIAILTEFLDLLFLALDSWGVNWNGLQIVEIATLFTINALTFLCLAAFIVWVLRERPGNVGQAVSTRRDTRTRTAPHYN